MKGIISKAVVCSLMVLALFLIWSPVQGVAAPLITTSQIADSAVTTPKIADSAVTDAKIVGPISATKIQDGVFQKKISNMIVVAKSGGDFDDIISAISSISDASEYNPYIIKVMPGVYNLSASLWLKNYVSLEGSGTLNTIINGSLHGANHSAISHITINSGNFAINNYNVSPTITDVNINGPGGTTGIILEGNNVENGIIIPILLNNINIKLDGDSVYSSCGIYGSATAKMSGINIIITNAHNFNGINTWGNIEIDKFNVTGTNIDGVGIIGKGIFKNGTINVSGSGNVTGFVSMYASSELDNVTINSGTGVMVFNAPDSKVLINNSNITSTGYSIYAQASGPATAIRVAQSQLSNGISHYYAAPIDIACFQVYDSNLLPVNCQ